MAQILPLEIIEDPAVCLKHIMVITITCITAKVKRTIIGVPAQKCFGGNEVLPKSCVVCPNYDFLVLYG